MQKQFNYKTVAIKPEVQADELPQVSPSSHSAAARAAFAVLAALQIAPYLGLLMVLFIACGEAGTTSADGGAQMVSLPYTISDFEQGTLDPNVWSSTDGLKLEVKAYSGDPLDNTEGGNHFLEVTANDPNAVPDADTPDAGATDVDAADAGEVPDAGPTDVEAADAGEVPETGPTDAEAADAGEVPETGPTDAEAADAGTPVQYPGTAMVKVGKSFIPTGAYLTFDIQMDQNEQIEIHLYDDDNNTWKIDIDLNSTTLATGGDDDFAYNYAHLQGKPGWYRVSIPLSGPNGPVDANSHGDGTFNPFPISSSGNTPDAGADGGTQTTGSVDGNGGLLAIVWSLKGLGQKASLDNVSITPDDGTKDLSTTATDGGADADVVDGGADAGTTDGGE